MTVAVRRSLFLTILFDALVLVTLGSTWWARLFLVILVVMIAMAYGILLERYTDVQRWRDP